MLSMASITSCLAICIILLVFVFNRYGLDFPMEFFELFSVLSPPSGALYESSPELHDREEFAAERDPNESRCVFLFHGVILFLSVLLKDGPPVRDFRILSADPPPPPPPGPRP